MKKIKILWKEVATKGRIKALKINKEKRNKYLMNIYNKNEHLTDLLNSKDIKKITLASLYLGEGSKHKRGSLCLGNSDAKIINLFLTLLRSCYKINENKFRCTLQCRADQNVKKLEKFWSDVTKIPFSQFYKARIDPRTIGKKTIKKDYKGVCRIDYFCADIYNELKIIGEIISNFKNGVIV